MSEFMEVLMGQQSLLMTLANVAPRAPEPTGPIANQSVAPPQSAPVPVSHIQPQGVWDIDAVSRDASDTEPLLEEDSMEAEVASQHSGQEIDPEVLDTNDPMWSVVERATRHLSVEWPMLELPWRSLFESSSAQPLQSRMLPAFPDFIKEVQSTWGAPASAPATSRKASAFNMQGASKAGLASFPPVGAPFATLVNAIGADQGSCMPEQAMQDHGGAPQEGVCCGHRGSQVVKCGQPPNGLPGGAHSRST
ncbi:UNVERIFIED_CONTAM: hypothetical protein FKN15_002210 [Acipenser sinensis]